MLRAKRTFSFRPCSVLRSSVQTYLVRRQSLLMSPSSSSMFSVFFWYDQQPRVRSLEKRRTEAGSSCHAARNLFCKQGTSRVMTQLSLRLKCGDWTNRLNTQKGTLNWETAFRLWLISSHLSTSTSIRLAGHHFLSSMLTRLEVWKVDNQVSSFLDVRHTLMRRILKNRFVAFLLVGQAKNYQHLLHGFSVSIKSECTVPDLHSVSWKSVEINRKKQNRVRDQTFLWKSGIWTLSDQRPKPSSHSLSRSGNVKLELVVTLAPFPKGCIFFSVRHTITFCTFWIQRENGNNCNE